MKHELSRAALVQFDRRSAVLSVSRYSLAVRCRLSRHGIECVVPGWADIGALLEQCAEVTLVAMSQADSSLFWVYARGQARLVPGAAFDGFEMPGAASGVTGDLYQVLRVELRRIEMVDERRGWGYRETLDF